MSYFSLRASIAFAALTTLCGAANAAAPTPAASGLQVVFGLIVVLGLLMGVAWWLKRFGPVRSAGGSAAKIVGGVSVGARERVMVVEVGDQWIVIGVAPGSVNALSTMPRQEHLIHEDAQAGAPQNFSAWLKHTMARRDGQS